jgi:hypothetical protein
VAEKGRVKRAILLALFLLISSRSEALMNGVEIEGHDDLVRLEFDQRKGVCTGFYVSETIIITAAHCLYDYLNNVSVLEIFSSSDKASLNVKIKRFILHPEYKRGSSRNDLGIIETTEYKDFQGEFRMRRPDPKSIGKLLIYGAGKIDVARKVYGRSSGANWFLRVGPFVVFVGHSFFSSRPGMNSSVAPNDSGSPIMDVNSNRVIAIASKTTSGLFSGSFWPIFNIGTLLTTQHNRDFLRAYSID